VPAKNQRGSGNNPSLKGCARFKSVCCLADATLGHEVIAAIDMARLFHKSTAVAEPDRLQGCLGSIL
jgi:hypothetical protein